MKNEKIREYINILKFVRTEPGSISVERIRSAMGEGALKCLKECSAAMSRVTRQDIEVAFGVTTEESAYSWNIDEKCEEKLGTLDYILTPNIKDINSKTREKITTTIGERYKVDYLLSVAFPTELDYFSLNLYACNYEIEPMQNTKMVQMKIGMGIDKENPVLFFGKSYELVDDISEWVETETSSYVVINVSRKMVRNEEFGEKIKIYANGRAVFINAKGTVFKKAVVLKDIDLLCGSTFAGALFLDYVNISGNIVEKKKCLKFINHSSILNFRNARFSKGISIVNLKCSNLNYNKPEISFEDAVFKFLPCDWGGNIAEDISIEIADCVLPKCKWNFYQSIMSQENLYFKNMDMDDNIVDFRESQFTNVIFININQMGEAYFEFNEAGLLEFKECVFNNPITIKNVKLFGLENCVNYSTITPSEEWTGTITSKKKHPLLEATIKHDNDGNKKKKREICKGQYAILKKSFQDAGMYAAEDEALIQYMNYSQNSILKRCIYGILNITGGYGTKPWRVFVTLLISGFVSAVVYWSNSGIDSKFVDAIYECFSSILTFQPLGNTPTILSVIYILFGFWNWFLLGYFSVAVVRKILR